MDAVAITAVGWIVVIALNLFTVVMSRRDKVGERLGGLEQRVARIEGRLGMTPATPPDHSSPHGRRVGRIPEEPTHRRIPRREPSNGGRSDSNGTIDQMPTPPVPSPSSSGNASPHRLARNTRDRTCANMPGNWLRLG